MWYLLYGLILLTSVIFLPIPDAFGLPKDAVFITLGFIMLAFSLANTGTKTLTFKNKWINLIFIYVILSFGYYFFIPLLSSKEQFVVCSINSYLSVLTVILSILLIQCLVEWTDNLNRWVKVGNFLCWLGFGFSCYAIIQFLGLDQIFHKDLRWLDNASPLNIGAQMHFVKYRMVTFLGNRRETAVFITMLSPMCLMFKGLRYKIIYGVMFLAVLLTMSSISIPVFIVGLLLYLLLTKRWIWSLAGFLSLLAFGLILLKFKPNFFNFYGKLTLWKDVFLGSIDRFFIGHGLGSFPMLQYKVIVGKQELLAINADFELLQLLSDGGIILVILIIGYLCNLYKRLILEFLSVNSMLLIGYTVGLTTFLMLSIGASPLHYPALLTVGLVYLASLEAQTKGGSYG